ncbi:MULTISPECIES: ABC transporter permease [Haloferacaceae]|uniref:ABC transporter permease n=1 Tax=Halorubrum glutamatedens TaxID=2707018 RepID=A0ABD5QN65_9EURY|nr:ABC transporter permease [Halobellus captivus]
MSLLKFTIKRTIHGIVVAWAALTIIFALRFISPVDIASALIPPDVPPTARESLIEDLGLDQPWYVQYLRYIGGVVQGDLGYSYVSRISVNQLAINRLPATLELAVAATLVSVVLSIPLGVISATNRHQVPDYLASFFALLGISTPNFWLGIMLVLLVSVMLGWFPTSGREFGFYEAMRLLILDGNRYGIIQWLYHITLPAITLGTYYVALLTRLTRSEMLDQLSEEYVRVLRAKGLPETLVTFKHVLRNSLIPVVTVLGLQFGSFINGAVVVEVVFRWPGMGEFLIRAIRTVDWPVIQGTLIIIAITWVTINFGVDILYTIIDPRVTLEGESE